MDVIRNLVIRNIEARSRKELGELSREFARAASEEKEDILAEMEFERFMIQNCQICLDSGL